MTELDRIEARRLELLRVDAQAESFADYVKRVSPRYWPPPRHLRPLFRVVESTRWRPTFALVSMPPRHGKTETLAHALAWWPKINPAVMNFYVTYGEGLRNATMRKTTKIAGRSGVYFDRDVKNLEEWHVAGYDGGLIASTVGGQITGRGCNGGVVIGDDMLKGRKQAESKLQRDTIWDYFRDDMMSRLEGGSDSASIIIVATRWHEDDIIGRLLKNGQGFDWEVICLPLVHDGDYNPVDEREFVGASTLWPEAGYDLAWARKVRKRGEYGFWGLYQQQPRPKGRRLFEEPARFDMPRRGSAEWPTWWRAFVQGKRLIIGCDCAGTEATHADHSAFVVMAVWGWAEKTEVWILHAEKMQLNTTKVAEVFMRAQRAWRALLAVEVNGVGRGVADQVRNPRQQIDMLRRVNSSLRMVEVTRSRDKYTEAQPFSACWNDGRVRVPVEVEWDVDDYVEQHKVFTGVADAEDDLVDAGVNGYNKIWLPREVNSRVRTENSEDF